MVHYEYMKKVLGISLAVLFVGALVLFFSQKKSEPLPVAPVEKVSVDGVGTPEGAAVESGMKSLRELASSNRHVECQIRYEQGGTEEPIEGTFFTSQGKLRGDFVVPAPEFGGVIISSMIVDTEMLFVWTDINGEMIGFKSDLATGDVAVKTKEPVPLDVPVQYSCNEWAAIDMSVFVPPTTVTFTDTDASLQEGMEYGTVFSE
jgi:hypothetical protein